MDEGVKALDMSLENLRSIFEAVISSHDPGDTSGAQYFQDFLRGKLNRVLHAAAKQHLVGLSWYSYPR